MVAKSSIDSSRVEVGEIDTSAPFQSVKDAVNLFGEVAFSGEKITPKNSKPQSAERFLVKETQLQWSQKDLEKVKDQLKNAEEVKAQALVELERAKSTVDELTKKINRVVESKNSAINATLVANNQVKKLENVKQENSSDVKIYEERDQYAAMFSELVSAKQELWKMHQERDEICKLKNLALSEADQAERDMKLNQERVGELWKDMSVIKETLEQVKQASVVAQQEQVEIFSGKNVMKKAFTENMDLSEKKMEQLKGEFNLEESQNLEKKISETENEVVSLQKQLENAKALDLESVNRVSLELKTAKESLEKMMEEEKNLRDLVDSLKLELENAKKEHSAVREKEAETETIAEDLQVKLSKVKLDLEAAVAEESKSRGASEELLMAVNQMAIEAEKSCNEAELMAKKAEEMKKEGEATQLVLKESEKQLAAALQEAEEAKKSESSAIVKIKSLSEKTNAARASISDESSSIRMSRDEFETLNHKVEESSSLAEMKSAAALAQVEAIKASENEAFKKLEMMKKEIEDMKAETAAAVKKAEMAEAAKKAIEGELRRWREREQKRAELTASQILSESSPLHGSAHIQISNQQQFFEVRKLAKAKSAAYKKQLLPNISGIFVRKKSQIESGSPSYLPGETPV